MLLSHKLLRIVTLVVVAIGIAVAPALADWNPGDGHKMHFPQLPDTFGTDVAFGTPYVLADDWMCSQTGPVSDVHFWFSAQGDWIDAGQPYGAQIYNVHLSIHANVPAGVGGVPYSTPGTLLWQRDFSVPAGEVKIREYANGSQEWYDPATGQVIPGDHQKVYQCNITGITEPFYQKKGEIYWLDIRMDAADRLGWKTADIGRYPPPYTGVHYEDDAVWGNPGAWQELVFPGGPYFGESLDLAFVITGEQKPWNHKMHFPQRPDPTGADVWFNSPYVLADDWRCSESGEVSDIHYWFSAYGDWLDFTSPLNQQIYTIHVSIHDDIPADALVPYSRPGVLLWERDYSVDSVRVTKCYTPGQAWYVPEQDLYTPDNHYCMYRVDIEHITDAFVQEAGKIYWLDVWMDAESLLGWKTADVDQYPGTWVGNHYQDDAVWALISPTPDWTDMIWPVGAPREGQSIDLAFVITKEPTTGTGDGSAAPFNLEQNIPNPFNPTTMIRYTLHDPAEMKLAVYDVRGELVRVLDQGVKPAGSYQAEWDARDGSGNRVASGVYLYRLTANGATRTRKMVLMK